jgi:hypothetical protein
MNLKIQFLLPVSEKFAENRAIIQYHNWYFLPASEAILQNKQILEEYLQTQPLTPENFVGGFAIETDTISWNQFYFGRFNQTMEWFSGFRRLLSGEKITMITVFDDSRLILKSDGNVLTLYETWDDYYPRTDFCPEIQVNFKDFLQKLIEESFYFAEFSKKIRQETDKLKDLPDFKAHHNLPLITQQFTIENEQKIEAFIQFINHQFAESPEQ